MGFSCDRKMRKWKKLSILLIAEAVFDGFPLHIVVRRNLSMSRKSLQKNLSYDDERRLYYVTLPGSGRRRHTKTFRSGCLLFPWAMAGMVAAGGRLRQPGGKHTLCLSEHCPNSHSSRTGNGSPSFPQSIDHSELSLSKADGGPFSQHGPQTLYPAFYRFAKSRRPETSSGKPHGAGSSAPSDRSALYLLLP